MGINLVVVLLIRKVECKMNPKKYVLWGIEKVLRSISNDMLDKIGFNPIGTDRIFRECQEHKK